jgi:CRISPR/Cas system endoribonuclease Cas6 (RAMP superfamily)
LCQPNNRLLWKDSNWITKKIPENLKQFKVDTELPSVENQCDKWLNVEDSNTYYYEFKESSNSKPIKYKKRTPTLKRKIKDFNYLKPLNLKNYV